MASKLDLYTQFINMFPDLSDCVVSYRKTGSKTIVLEMQNGKHLFFLYYGPDNWNIGTKQWRRMDSVPKKRGNQNG